MIKVKHFMEPSEEDDGPRAWVEPIGLTRDLQEWCLVDEVLPMLGPPVPLRDWFLAHRDEYERFRGYYHQWLSTGPYRPYLEQLAVAGQRENFTLLHAGDDPDHNCATALREFITALEAHCLRDQ